jgi:hypothetical protein
LDKQKGNSSLGGRDHSFKNKCTLMVHINVILVVRGSYYHPHHQFI